MEERTKQLTADGSYTLYERKLGVTYHSVYGAVQESRHVFITSGFQFWLKNCKRTETAIQLLEVGFGTGLNALLTLEVIQETNLTGLYHAVEPFPLRTSEWQGLNYTDIIQRPDLHLPFTTLHQTCNDIPAQIISNFILHRHVTTIQEFHGQRRFNLVYYDAFAPGVQPEMWTLPVFQKLFDLMVTGSVLVTYSAKGTVRRALQEAGFLVEKLPGPPHKREMIRAVKM